MNVALPAPRTISLPDRTTASGVREAGITLGLLAAPLAAEGQPAARLVCIEICSAGQTRSSPLYQAFEQQLRALGYVEGRNVSIEFRSAGGDSALAPNPNA